MQANYAGSLLRLQNIMNELRENCPWDKKQTIETLRPLSIEEVYELAGAIDNGNFAEIKEELGDILLHIVFYIKIAEEQKQFTLEDVIEGVCNKLVHRHPHIYSNVEVQNEDEVKKNWEQLKIKEGKKGLLAGVPKALPAMVKAIRIQEKSKQVGFEWDAVSQVRDKLNEEIEELDAELNAKVVDQQKVTEEFGDVLFSMVNYARFLGVDPEYALELTNKKFMNRFEKMEAKVQKNNANMADMSLEALDALWNSVKKEL